MAVTYEPIVSQTLASSAAYVDFTSIPQTFTDIISVVIPVGSAATNLEYIFNSDTSNNYSVTGMSGTGSATFSFRSSSGPALQLGVATTTPSTNIVNIMSYANANVFKTVLSADEYYGVALYRRVGLWRSYSAITDIRIQVTSGTFSSGSTFSLYGIKAA